MKIGSKVKMNKLSNYAGQEGCIFKIDESRKSFIITLNSGLTIAAPSELVEVYQEKKNHTVCISVWFFIY